LPQIQWVANPQSEQSQEIAKQTLSPKYCLIFLEMNHLAFTAIRLFHAQQPLSLAASGFKETEATLPPQKCTFAQLPCWKPTTGKRAARMSFASISWSKIKQKHLAIGQ
jgi:hypothetical protein